MWSTILSALLRTTRGMALGVALAVLVLDQIVKAWVLHGLDLPSRLTIPVNSFLSLHMVYNPGISLGMLQASSSGARWVLVVLTTGIAGFVAWWLWREEKRATALSLGLVLGGAIGNIIDRIAFGSVVDFIQVRFFPWVFNVADAAISIGVALLLAFSFVYDRREKAAQADKAAADTPENESPS